MSTSADRSVAWLRRGAVLPAALLLSALASAPAFAATSPSGSGAPGGVPAHPPGPVHQIVKTVSAAAGVPDPLQAESPTGPAKHHRPALGPIGRGWHPSRAQKLAGTWVEPPSRHQGTVALPRGAGDPSVGAATGARLFRPALPVAQHKAADAGAAVRAAVARLFGASVTTARLVAVVAGMLVLGFLAAAHIRSVQNRLAALG